MAVRLTPTQSADLPLIDVAMARPTQTPAPDAPARRDDADVIDWVDYMDSEGESYVFFAIDDDWPGPLGGASRGAP